MQKQCVMGNVVFTQWLSSFTPPLSFCHVMNNTGCLAVRTEAVHAGRCISNVTLRSIWHVKLAHGMLRPILNVNLINTRTGIDAVHSGNVTSHTLAIKNK